MNPTKIAQTIQQAREWARAEYEAKTKGLIFTKDFQTRQEALMHDPLATVGERVMAWILRRSWGEFVLYAVKNDGEPAYQRDCARDLKLDKKAVSKAVAYYQTRGYLESHPKKLYPVISPVLGGPPKKVTRSGDFLQFFENWKVTHSSDFQELEVARSTVERIRKVVLSEYKKSRHQDKNAGLSLVLKTSQSISETGSSSSAVQSPPPPEPKAEEEEQTPYERFKTQYPAAHFDEGKAKPIFEGKTKTQQAHILDRLQIYLICDRWKDENGRWIPFAGKWLESYDADPPPALKKASTKSPTRAAADAFFGGD